MKQELIVENVKTLTITETLYKTVSVLIPVGSSNTSSSVFTNVSSSISTSVLSNYTQVPKVPFSTVTTIDHVENSELWRGPDELITPTITGISDTFTVTSTTSVLSTTSAEHEVKENDDNKNIHDDWDERYGEDSEGDSDIENVSDINVPKPSTEVIPSSTTKSSVDITSTQGYEIPSLVPTDAVEGTENTSEVTKTTPISATTSNPRSKSIKDDEITTTTSIRTEIPDENIPSFSVPNTSTVEPEKNSDNLMLKKTTTRFLKAPLLRHYFMSHL